MFSAVEAVEAVFRLLLPPAEVLGLLVWVKSKAFGNSAADRPDFLQRFVTFRFHLST